MFIGRERELTALQNQYNSSKFEFTVIYGRRRVGKTAIINEFVKDKDDDRMVTPGGGFFDGPGLTRW